jgi:hypothetical protein
MCNRGSTGMVSFFSKISIVLLVAISLSGCPRFAYIDLYNNTSEVIFVSASNEELKVDVGTRGSFKLTGSEFIVTSELGNWKYKRLVPHKGEDGPYFNGTLKAQINQDGKIYALELEESAPKLTFESQPKGYPIESTTHHQ